MCGLTHQSQTKMTLRSAPQRMKKQDSNIKSTHKGNNDNGQFHLLMPEQPDTRSDASHQTLFT